MLTARLALRRGAAAARTHPHARLVHASPAARAAGSDPSLSQGHATAPAAAHAHKDPHSRAARAGADAAHSSNPHDAASGARGAARPQGEGANTEAVGFQDQVGGQSAERSRADTKGGEREAAAPSLRGAIKQALGMADTKDVKDRRKMHTRAAETETEAGDGEGARKPKDGVRGEQNAHLQHKRDARAPDGGRGSAAANPALPSHRVPQTASNAHANANANGAPSKRAFATSAAQRKDAKHTAETYFKDVDTSASTTGGTTHTVDGGSAALEGSERESGPYSQAGAGDEAYKHVSKDAPYEEPVSSHEESQSKLRYGGKSKEGAGRTSESGEGPEGASKGGRKPE